MTLLFTGDNADGSKLYTFFCPACGNHHGFTVGPKSPGAGPRWTFNGDFAAPTFTPSLRCLKPDPAGVPGADGQVPMITTCHTNVTDGKIIYHADCPHSFAGKTVPMVDLDAQIATETAEPVAPAPAPVLPETPEPSPAAPLPSMWGGEGAPTKVY
jgi:hypothetical protein